MVEEYEKTIKDYVYLAIRRKYIIAVSIIIFMAASIIISLILPPVYKSEATIAIEQQHIPTELVKPTVTSLADERIQKTQQKIMTTSNIIEIIRKNKLYPKEQKSLKDSELVDLFKENSSLELINVDIVIKGRKQLATIAFKLSFHNKNALAAQNVVTDLVTLFLNENAQFRITRAKEISDFLEEASEEFKFEIQEVEKNIAEYKIKYSGSLPELLPVNLASISRIDNQIQQLNLQEKMLVNRRINLQSQLNLMASTKIEGPENAAPESLEWLNSEYSRLRGRYSSSHPDVRYIKRKIDDFEKEIVSPQTNKIISNSAFIQLNNELDNVSFELKNITQSKHDLKDKLKEYEARVAQTHQVEQGYYELIRDLDSHKAKYQELRNKLLGAKLSQILEEQEKAEKFSLLEPADLPSKPFKPNRIKIVFMSSILSILCGFGIGFIVESMDNSIKGYKELENIIGMDALAVIPYIENDEDKRIRLKNNIHFMIFCAVFFVVIIISIHFLYKPIDIIFSNILYKISML